MKNIVKFAITEPKGKLTIDYYNELFQETELVEFLDMYLPYTKLYQKISVKNFNNIPMELLNRLTNQYLHGVEIEFVTPKRNFHNVYKLKEFKPFYTYKWVPLDLTKPIPRSLANFEFTYNGKPTTYLNAVKTLTSTKFLPSDIWNALDVYSKQQIDKCREFNRGEYAYAEEWYKQLTKDCMPFNMKVYSPNEKTYYEALAEVNFNRACADAVLPDGQRPLNVEELCFLQKYASAYGVEIPQFQWKVNSRKTNHGYTQEPERVYCGMSTSDYNRVIFDPRNDNNLPKFVRQGLYVQSCESSKLLRDAYYQLVWIMKHLKDDGLMPGWKRCPVCHELHRENDGCSCGYDMPIEFVSADKLFYGISNAYEDYDSTLSAYDDLDELED